MRHFIAALSLLSFTRGARLDGQTSSVSARAIEVRGRTVDTKTNGAVGHAAVVFSRKGTVEVVARTSTNVDGTFAARVPGAGSYTLRISLIGFAPGTKDVNIARETGAVDLGSIALSPIATTLATMSVVEDRATIATESDRSSYRAKDVAPAAASATDVLDALPSVQVDADGKVSYRGNDNVTVQIDGRPSPLSGAPLASYLKSLPANIVDRIEVISNPSAKNDPEGMAGIINLVLKRQMDLGTSIGVNAAYTSIDRYNVSGTFGDQRGRFTTFATIGVNADARPISGINDRERYASLQRLLWTTEEDIASTATNDGQNASITHEIALRPGFSLSQALNVNRHANGDGSLNGFTERDGARVLMSQYDRPRIDKAHGWLIDSDVAVKRAFEPGQHEFSAELRISGADDEDFLTLWRQAAGGNLDSPVARHNAERDATTAGSQQLSAQVDYTRSVTNRLKLEAGYKGNVRRIDRDFVVDKDSLGTGVWAASPLSNSLRFDESVHAAYAMTRFTTGIIDLQGGLRAESAVRDFSFAGAATHYPHIAASVFPSGSLTYTATATTQLRASYSRRIRRPGTSELNPFPSFWDAQNAFIGNPELDAEYTDAFELSATRNGGRGMIQLAPFYRRTGNAIRIDANTSDVIDGRDVTSLTLRNLAASTSWGADLTGSLRLGRRVSGFASANVFKMVTDGGTLTSLTSNAVGWSAKLNGSFEPTKTWLAQAAYFYRAPLRVPRFQFAQFEVLNASVRKSFDSDKASVTLRISDPFNSGRMRVRGGDDHVVQLTERTFGMRQIALALQYSYGRPPRVREPKREQDAAPSFIPPP